MLRNLCVQILGQAHQSGVYLLRIELPAALTLSFGRFQGGRRYALPPGDYLYVGSALAKRGALSLAPRLLRHATRSGLRSAHPIRPALLTALCAAGLGSSSLRPPASKRCYWNIDHVLDQPAAQLTQVWALRTTLPLEAHIAALLAADAHTFVIAPGLGAHDNPGATHLLGICAQAQWWAELTEYLLAIQLDC